ncbi:Proteasome maturation protein-like [Porphyridium purpureum]|uniref:Proteasome maturation protein-like n=1 Tax=Porphyridium purpureum TaxID=35688 RepID=A0A5J4YQ16_PORPP|nr:Proteasome maturation protein-like [Porphyridium purpureum]|eukprot:POR3476..scf236_6
MEVASAKTRVEAGAQKAPAQVGVEARPFGSYVMDATVVHPVQRIEHMSERQARETRDAALADLYGIHMPMRMEMERQIVSQFHRLPGLPSSHLALEFLNNTDLKIDFADYMNLPSERPDLPVIGMHEQMEKAIGMRMPSEFR